MTQIKDEDIVGFYVGDKLVCGECINHDEEEEMTPDTLLLRESVENTDDHYFCDRCKQRMN